MAFAPAFAEEDGRGRVAIGDGFDVHGSHYTPQNNNVKIILHLYMGTYCNAHLFSTDAESEA
jgi:hypothetical protein